MIFSSVYLSITFYWMIFLTLLAVFAPLEVPSYYFFIGVLCSWLIFSVLLVGFLAGRKKVSRIELVEDSVSIEPSLAYQYKGMVAIFTTSFLMSQYAMNFYTGQTIFSLINNLASGKSLYALYQAYFMNGELAVFTLAKVPAILSLILLKLILLWSFFTYHFKPVVIKKRYYLLIMLICLNYLMFSFARGTNFEVFEILIMFILSFALRLKYRKASIPFYAIIFSAFLLYGVMSLYLATVSARFGDNEIWSCSSGFICLDTQSILYSIMPTLATFLFLISGYFLFGLLYISTFCYSFLDDAGLSSLLAFFPLGFDLAGIDITREGICGKYIDCGVSWTPSIIFWISGVGLLGVLFLLFLIGYIASIAEKDLQRPKFSSFALTFYLILMVLALPTGNFVFTSSSNIVVFLGSLMFFMWEKLLKRGVK